MHFIRLAKTTPVLYFELVDFVFVENHFYLIARILHTMNASFNMSCCPLHRLSKVQELGIYDLMVDHMNNFDSTCKSFMVTSSNGNIFRVTGLLCGEFAGLPVNSPHKGQWRAALMFSLISACTNGCANNRYAGHLKHHRAHYDVIVMLWLDRALALHRLSCWWTFHGI